MKATLCMAVVLLVSACASAPVPAARVASTHAAVRGAGEVGARDVPRAALHLRYARDQINTANRLIRDGEMERADLMLQRAEADAELALSLAREDHARREAGNALTAVRSMRQSMQQGGNP